MAAHAASGAMSRTDTQPQTVADAIRLIFAAPDVVARNIRLALGQ